MRTFRFTYNKRIDADGNFSVSTEVVTEDEESEQAGYEAAKATFAFLEGIGRRSAEETSES